MFKRIYKEVISRLENDLPSWLTYHSPDHTLYVLEKAEFLAKQEGVKGRDLFLIKVAALYHDLGFVKDREDHENTGCEMASMELPEYELTPEEINRVCDMITATKIPQKPKTISEKILADADLEYMGTDQYHEISEKLYQEMLHSRPDLSREEWNEIQVNFLSNHSYHTNYCKKHCEAIKAKHLKKLRKQLTQSN
ncbi:HD domain-containing protein [Salinimicrobium xinjiangense]|uniref:HD domain-containing protein n=1 Tax=Salinimicrobium xinjiangense TaxID=438596 RepID=UPI0004121F62|nr:HD domain-containing protein [Salinimicrobium xinjiangense]